MFEKYTMITLYCGVLVVLGWLAARRIRNMSDFVVGRQAARLLGGGLFGPGDRRIRPGCFSALPAWAPWWGFSAYWIVVGEVIGVALAWFLMAPRFKRLTDQYESMTVIDYLVSRFRSSTQTLRVISAISLCFFVLIYISAQIDATGSAFASFLDWNYLVGAIVGFMVVAAYCIAGGFLAAAWTDMFQGAVMLLCLVLLPVVAYLSLSNPDAVYAGLQAIDPGLVSIWGAGGFTLINVCLAVGMVAIGLGFLGSPQVFAAADRDSQHRPDQSRQVGGGAVYHPG